MNNIIQERINLYHQAKNAYYGSSEPIMSDEEFDNLEDQLVEAGYNPFIGEFEFDDSNKIKHNHKMLSLGKKKVLDDEMDIEMAQDLFDKYGVGMLSWKYDGLALETSYVNGNLVSMSTRGDGEYGRNVIDKLRSLVPTKIGYFEKVDIRYEVVMNQRVFEEKYASKFKHSRNLVSGIVRDEDVNDQRKNDLQVKVIELIHVETKTLLTPEVVGQWFTENYKENYICKSAQDIKNFFDKMYKERDQYDFGTDGTVYSSINQATFEYKGNHPVYSIAIKFKPPRLISTITDIVWTLQRTGNFIPVIKFSPLIVDGREIKQASGYNFMYLVKHDLCIGKQVQIILSNDIIPMIKPLQ